MQRLPGIPGDYIPYQPFVRRLRCEKIARIDVNVFETFLQVDGRRPVEFVQNLVVRSFRQSDMKPDIRFDTRLQPPRRCRRAAFRKESFDLSTCI